MPGLSPDLHKRLCDALIASGYCDSAADLRAVCVDERLAPWRDDLPGAPAPRRRAEAVIAALCEQHAEGGENALALLRHALPHLTRTVLGGVAFGLRDSMELVKGATAPPYISPPVGGIKQIRVSGGGAKSALWRQILADVIGSELVTVNTTEGGAFGAGVWATVPEACRATIKVVSATSPQPAQVKVYDDLYPLYRGLYPALKPTFDAVG